MQGSPSLAAPHLFLFSLSPLSRPGLPGLPTQLGLLPTGEGGWGACLGGGTPLGGVWLEKGHGASQPGARPQIPGGPPWLSRVWLPWPLPWVRARQVATICGLEGSPETQPHVGRTGGSPRRPIDIIATAAGLCGTSAGKARRKQRPRPNNAAGPRHEGCRAKTAMHGPPAFISFC